MSICRSLGSGSAEICPTIQPTAAIHHQKQIKPWHDHPGGKLHVLSFLASCSLRSAVIADFLSRPAQSIHAAHGNDSDPGCTYPLFGRLQHIKHLLVVMMGVCLNCWCLSVSMHT